MSKRTYFPLLMDRWVAGTRELTFEQKGFYIDLLVYLYDSGRAIKDASHAARITGCDPRTARRLLADLRPKFYLRSDGLRHKLVTEIIRNRGVIRGLGTSEIGTNLPHDPDPDPASPPPSTNKQQMEEERVDTAVGSDDAKPTRCPILGIVHVYHEILCPPCPQVEKLTKERKGFIQQRWREDLPTLVAWRNYFNFVKQSDFLMGRKEPSANRKPFIADLEWLTRPNNYAKIAEERYHG